MPDPLELLTVARRLSEIGSDPGPGDAQIRRAVSTAYHALFHKVARAAAERFVGIGQEATAAYAMLYRGFDHRTMKSVCEALSATNLSERYQIRLGRAAVSPDIRDFADAFPLLQQARQQADYNPAAEFAPSDALGFITAAEVAMAAFDRAAQDERTDILALLLVGARG